jgi:hypothetical protein
LSQAGYRKNAKHLAASAVDRDSLASRRHLAMGVDYDRDGGGVDELAALKADQDLVVLGRGFFEGLSQPVGYRQVDLALDLDFMAAWLQAFFNEPKRSHPERPMSELAVADREPSSLAREQAQTGIGTADETSDTSSK